MEKMPKTIRGLEAGKRPALVISECQRGILDPALTTIGGLAAQAAERNMFVHIARLADAFRGANLPVVHAHIGFLPGYAGAALTSPMMGMSRRNNKLMLGSPDAEPMPGVEPQPGDFVSLRHSGLVMWEGTHIDSTLRNCGVDTIVFTGVSTNLALFGGTLGAVERGYYAVIPEDATSGASAESHQWMLQNSLNLLAWISSVDAVIDAISRLST